jgi:hypothetical protein
VLEIKLPDRKHLQILSRAIEPQELQPPHDGKPEQ